MSRFEMLLNKTDKELTNYERWELEEMMRG